MSYQLIVENASGETIDLTAFGQYQVISVEGIEMPPMNINRTQMAVTDGSLYNNAYMNDRALTITIQPLPPVEFNRNNLYKYFRLKEPTKIYFKNGVRDVFLVGYLESMPTTFFEEIELVQISLICPQPYFQNTHEGNATFSALEDLFEFPFAIEAEGIPFAELTLNAEENIINEGEIETGMIIKIEFRGETTNPTIFNMETRESFGVKGTFRSGDVLVIDTNSGNKSVDLIRGGTTLNYFNYILPGSVWLQAHLGDNLLTYSADSGFDYIYLSITVADKYARV